MGGLGVRIRWVRTSGPLTVACAIGNAVAAGLQATVTGQSAPTAPAITSPAFLVAGTVNTVYPSTTFTASGTAPITWSVTAGTLPAGMSFSTAGVLSGTPTATASGSITFTATNALGADSRALTLTVNAAGANMPYVMENVVADGVVGYAYTQDLTITGRWLYDDPTNIPTVSIISGSLPTGLSLNTTVTSKPGSTTAKRVVVSGTPEAVGTSSVTVQVTNSAGSTQKTISFKTYAYDSSRINPPDLTWAGSFRLQRVTTEDDSITQLGYSGRFAGMSLSTDGQRLFITSGSNKKIAEYQIPALVQSSTVANLNTASIVQPFTYPFGAYTMSDLMNKASAPGPTEYEITGMKAVGSDLLITGFYFYDTGAYQQYQVVKRPSTLSTSAPVISSQIGGAGETRYWVGGVEEIPSAFRTTYSLPSHSIGRFGGSIDGSLSLGPAYAAFNPASMTDKGVVAATKMAVYPLTSTSTTAQSLAYQFGYKSISYGSPTTVNSQNKWYTGGHSVQVGAAWLTSKPVVLSIGYIGIGSPWYDAGNGMNTDPNFPAFAMEDTWMNHGNHCAPYIQYVWAYTEAEIALVLTGAKQPWEALPYDVWPLPTTPYKQQPGEYPWVGGVAHDPVNRKIYVAQPKKDVISDYVKWPIIDVYTYPA
jgi:hypothetical protein